MSLGMTHKCVYISVSVPVPVDACTKCLKICQAIGGPMIGIDEELCKKRADMCLCVPRKPKSWIEENKKYKKQPNLLERKDKYAVNTN